MTSSREIEQEKVKEMKIIVHRVNVNHEDIREIVQKEKTGFFVKWGFLKPKQEEILRKPHKEIMVDAQERHRADNISLEFPRNN